MTPPLHDEIRALAEGLTVVQRKAVCVMEAYADSDTPCRNAKDLAAAMGATYHADEARAVARELVKTGLAESESGLVTSDGDFYGSGWHLTERGLTLRAHLLQENDHAPHD